MFEFTFHYVSINSGDAVKVNDYDTNLHSTMYLLILSETVNRTVSNTYLHSTMYLLIPTTMVLCFISLYLFTFHYVSINSSSRYIR